ncbi:hypothetical protein [Xylocopilactobacillus apis]|uniref:Uncharacterized protein n=1 Tax=Xylocopilactobacillus apis TaxID=2932183 RepID=A0AAU9DQ43_9LACO|nr:hypothetical protein [Xylocopilactobacillus apis]BDR57218.1 hypothetical protein KIMC2_17800 [Xylocopilactobacillus apis]
MNELDDIFGAYLKTIQPAEHQQKFHHLLIKIDLTLELNAYPELRNGHPSFFLNGQPIISLNASDQSIVVKPGAPALKHFGKNIETAKIKFNSESIQIPWDQEFPTNLVNSFIKFNEANILDNAEGIDHAED